MSPETIGFLIIVLLFALFLLGLEIGFAMGLAGFIGFAAIVSVDSAMILVAKDIASVISSYGFTVVPMFVLMGQLGASGGVARGLYDSAYKFVGHVPGGLAIGTVVAATAFKAICGSTPATAATFASVAVPEMDRYGYDRKLSCGTVASVGTLGVLIPPSVVLIIYGIITETSIGKLFLAGLIPGLMIAFSFIVTLVGWSLINPSLSPKGEKSSWRERLASLPPVLLVMLVFLVVVGGLMQGFLYSDRGGECGHICRIIIDPGQKRHGSEEVHQGFSGHIAHSVYGPHDGSRSDYFGSFFCSDQNAVHRCGMVAEKLRSPEGPFPRGNAEKNDISLTSNRKRRIFLDRYETSSEKHEHPHSDNDHEHQHGSHGAIRYRYPAEREKARKRLLLSLSPSLS